MNPHSAIRNPQSFEAFRLERRAADLDQAERHLRLAIVWRDRWAYARLGPHAASANALHLMRALMRRHALDSRRRYLGQRCYAGPDPRDAYDLPVLGTTQRELIQFRRQAAAA